MEKKSLKSRLTPHNDYSVFDIEKPVFRKYPLADYTDTTFTSDFHQAKMKQAIQLFRKLNSLTVTEFFMYQPYIIDRLRMTSLTEANSESDVSDMTLEEVMSYMGTKVDKEQDFDIGLSMCSAFMETIKDSRYTHPLFSSLFIHNREMVKLMTDGKHGDYDPEKQKDLYQSMNDFFRERDLKFKRRDKSNLFGHDDLFGPFFNNIVIPSIVVSKYL